MWTVKPDGTTYPTPNRDALFAVFRAALRHAYRLPPEVTLAPGVRS